MTVAWREFQRGTALIRRARDYGRTHQDATAENTLNALGEPATENNSLYARAGLFQAEQERDPPRVEDLPRLLWARKPKEENSTMDIDPDRLAWFKGSSAPRSYVKAAHVTDGAGVALRDSKTSS